MADNEFNLDDLESQPQAEPSKADLSGELGLTYNPASSSQSIADIYDRHTKKIFVVDESGSMSDLLFDLSAVEHFDWSKVDRKGEIEARIQRAKEAYAAEEEANAYVGGNPFEADEDEDEDDEDGEGISSLFNRSDSDRPLTDNPANDHLWMGIEGLPKKEQRAAIVKTDMWNELMLTMDPSSRPPSKAKIEVVRDLAEKMVRERLDRIPDADIHLITFGETAEAKQVYSPESLIAEIRNLKAWQGSTYIFRAIRKAISLCRKSPSPVQSHHIILVTDGLAHDAPTTALLIQDMQKLGIILDVVHISSWDSGRRGLEDDRTSELKQICAATGGAYTLVTRLTDLEVKYLEAGRRLCLPAPAGA